VKGGECTDKKPFVMVARETTKIGDDTLRAMTVPELHCGVECEAVGSLPSAPASILLRGFFSPVCSFDITCAVVALFPVFGSCRDQRRHVFLLRSFDERDRIPTTAIASDVCAPRKRVKTPLGVLFR